MAECIARMHLKKHGYSLLDSNFTHKKYEIDVIAAFGECLVFVEVKSRSSGSLCTGYFSVDKKKKSNIKVAAKAYIKLLKAQPKSFRFDIIEVTWNENFKLNWLCKNKLIARLLCKFASKNCQIAHFENVSLRC